MTDLDALTALLAAATMREYPWHADETGTLRLYGDRVPFRDPKEAALAAAAVNALPALIEAARREAALDRAVKELASGYLALLAVRHSTAHRGDIYDGGEAPRDCSLCADGLALVDAARSLLLASAGTATPGRGNPE